MPTLKDAKPGKIIRLVTDHRVEYVGYFVVENTRSGDIQLKGFTVSRSGDITQGIVSIPNKKQLEINLSEEGAAVLSKSSSEIFEAIFNPKTIEKFFY